MSSQAVWPTLVRGQLRRDRVLLPAWISVTCLMYGAQAQSIVEMYPTQASLDRAAEAMSGNAAMIAMTGPARALDTVGGQVAWQSAAFGAVMAGLMSMLVVGRHTRQEEETGRSELVHAGALGRLTPLLATVALALTANAVLGAAVAGTLITYDLPVEGSVASGIALTLTGWVFTGAAAVAAQLTHSTRTCYAITGLVIGGAYFLRAVGDVGPGTLSWASPIGWSQALRPYAEEQWWPAMLSAVTAVTLVAVAAWLQGRRDHGAGLWTTRGTVARDQRVSSWGLAWRLQRGNVLGWGAALSLVGFGYGAVADSARDMVGDSRLAEEMFASGEVDGFLGTAVLVLALLTAAFGVVCAQRTDVEERAGRVDALLSNGLTRARWALEHTVLSILGVIGVLAVAGFSTGAGYAVVTGSTDELWGLTGAAAAYLPAVLAVVAAVVLAHGLALAAGLVGWLVLGWSVFIGLLGPLMDLPDAVMRLSPFEHIATMPSEPFDPLSFVAVFGVALAFLLTGQLRLHRRDLR